MKLLHVSVVVCLGVLAAGVLPGCDGSQQPPPRQRPTLVKVEEELPELDDPIGPLDGQRIEVAPPKGWHVPPQSSRWIIRFTPSEQMRYPSIIVRAESYHGVSDVSRANVQRFAEQIAADLAKGKSAAAPVTAIEIGSFVGVSHEGRGRASYGPKEIVVELLRLDTVVAGRKYTVELRTRAGDLKLYRPYLFAVAGGIRFLEAEAEDKGEAEDAPLKPDAGLEFEPLGEDKPKEEL